MRPSTNVLDAEQAPLPLQAVLTSANCDRPFFIQRLSCGFPSPAEDSAERRLDLNSLMIQNVNATFFFRVQGDSMSGIGLVDGSYIIVDRSIPPCNGSIVLAVVNQDYTVKRLVIEQGRVSLHAEHPDYPAIFFGEGDELTVWGTVTGWAYRLPG